MQHHRLPIASRLLQYALCLLWLLPTIPSPGQTLPKTIYYIDSVFILKLDADDNILVKKEVAVMRKITHPDTLQQLQLVNIDTVIYVITRAYRQRPDSIRHIPSLKTLTIQDRRFFYKDTSLLPYTGPFLNYYLNGALKTRGQIKDGYIDGYVNSYYKDGNLQASHYYSGNAEDGVREEYYPNGSIKKRGKVSNGYMEDYWQEWHSTGKLKSEIRYLHSRPFYQEGEDVFYSILNRIPYYLESNDYKKAIEKLNECKKANANEEKIFFYYGKAYLGLKRFPEAIKAFTQAIDLEPLYTDALTQRAFTTARLLQQMNNSDTTGRQALQASVCNDINTAIQQGETPVTFRQLQEMYCIQKTGDQRITPSK